MSLTPLLQEALAALLPDRAETLLVRSALLGGKPGQRAFDEWQRHVGNPLKALRSSDTDAGRLLGLIREDLWTEGMPIEPTLRSLLRAVQLREELRALRVRAACHDVLGTLSRAGVSPVVVGGVALAEHAYGELSLRHCHDLDVWVAEQHFARALEALPGARHSDRRDAVAIHDSGFSVSLHMDLGGDAAWTLPEPAIRRRVEIGLVAGTRTLMLDPADQLIHTLTRAVARGPRSVQWAPDVWFLLAAQPRLDWQLVFDRAVRARLATVALLYLGWAGRELQAPVHPEFLAAIGQAAAHEQPLAGDILLGRARGVTGFRGLAGRASSRRGRRLIWRRAAFPCAGYLRLVAAQPSRGLPWLHVDRARRYLSARAGESTARAGESTAAPV